MSDLESQNLNALKCEICEKDFKSNEGLRKHFNNVHNYSEEHQCNICQKNFKLHAKLILHVKIVHENKKLHKCDVTHVENH